MSSLETTILDTRPVSYFTGEKQDESRGGHIPGASNRPYSEDLVKIDGYITIKPGGDLEAIYEKLIPTKEMPVILHCRTGH